MSSDERDFVLSVLRYCSGHDKMGCTDIADRLHDLGMKCIVIKNTGWGYKTDAKWTWSYCTIIKSEFRPNDSTEITCADKGDMSNDDRFIVAEALRYCLFHKEMKPSDIRKRLNDREKYTMKDVVGFEYDQGSDKLTWSKWSVPAFGDYSVVMMKSG